MFNNKALVRPEWVYHACILAEWRTVYVSLSSVLVAFLCGLRKSMCLMIREDRAVSSRLLAPAEFAGFVYQVRRMGLSILQLVGRCCIWCH